MNISDLVAKLQAEFVLARDPHMVQRFIEIVEQHFAPKPETVTSPNLDQSSEEAK